MTLPPNALRTATPANLPAMLLAAGRGERMRPLTDTCPKPLLAVQGKPLLQWHLEALARAGVAQAVINTAWLGEQIADRFNDVFATQPLPDKRNQLSNEERLPQALALRYSHEGRDFGHALETAGGIARALPWLDDMFWVAAGDVYAPDFVFGPDAVARFRQSDALAHLWLVPNPTHNPRGDFGLQAPDGGGPALALNLLPDDPRPRYTYSTLGLYRKALFAPPYTDSTRMPPGNPQGIKAPLAPLLRAAMDNGRVTAELYSGRWTDVGTPERLQALNQPDMT